MKHTEPMVTFRVFPELGNRHYFTVTLWPTLTALRRSCERQLKGYRDRDSQAFVITKGRGHSLGSIEFALPTLTPFIVAHEATHAAMSFVTAMKDIPLFSNVFGCAMPGEERFCDVVGRIVWRITGKLNGLIH